MQRNNSLKRISAEMTLVKMTDERLSDTAEALSARIAALEQKILSGGFAVSNYQPSEGSSILNIVEEADAKNEKNTEEVIQPADENSCPLSSWIEVVKNIELSGDMGLSSTLRRASASISGKKIIISVNDSFSKLLIEKDGNATLIATAINSSEAASGVMPQDISVIVNKNDKETADSLSDF